jgi:hypothetical protein
LFFKSTEPLRPGRRYPHKPKRKNEFYPCYKKKRFFSTQARRLSGKEKKKLVEPQTREPSISRQYQLLGLNRFTMQSY